MRCDVVIVGAGAAGCVLAARLSEDPDRRVVLVEAGPDYPTLADLPPEIASAWAPVVSHDWGYVSEPDGRGRALPLPRARLVGGCAATNAAFALRGSPADYDRWQALGNGGWSFADVLPVFRRLESDRDFADEWHGSDGPIPIRRLWPEASTPLQRAFLQAASEAGHATVLDHNRPWAVGAGPGPRNVGDGGVRVSTALAYLATARPRPNLTVRPHVLVDAWSWAGNGPRGSGWPIPTRRSRPAPSCWRRDRTARQRSCIGRESARPRTSNQSASRSHSTFPGWATTSSIIRLRLSQCPATSQQSRRRASTAW